MRFPFNFSPDVSYTVSVSISAHSSTDIDANISSISDLIRQRSFSITGEEYDASISSCHESE